MSRNRKFNRKNRTFHLELLERRELMSASPWNLAGDVHDDDPVVVVAASTPAHHSSGTQIQAQSATQAAATVRPRPFVVTVQGGALKIQATQAGHMITVHQGTKTFIVEARLLTGNGLDGTPYVGLPLELPLAGINKIEYRGTDGADRFRNQTNLESTAYGFKGIDTLEGGSNRDVLYGGRNTDWLYGNAGNDELFGGSGADRLYGGNDHDTLDGGANGDNIDGQDGWDTAVKPNPSVDRVLRIEHVDAALAALASVELRNGFSPTAQAPTANLSVPPSSFPPGSLDSSFGTGGKVRTNISGMDWAEAVAIQKDGKIVVVGRGGDDFVVARYLANGKLDTSFGNAGWTRINFAGVDTARDVLIQPDGKIVVVGGVKGLAEVGKYTDYWRWLENDIGLVRLTSTGKLDTSFGTGGKVVTNISGTDWAEAVALQSDGKIVVVGSGGNDFVAVRYTRDGKLDTSFGTGGKTRVNFAGVDVARDVVIQRDGKILIVGAANNEEDFGLARLTSTGKLDTSFGDGGRVRTNISGTDWAEAVALQPDGKIVVVGRASNDFGVVRYHSNGKLDTSFAAGGKLRVNFSGVDTARDVVIQPNGKIVVVGGVGGKTTDRPREVVVPGIGFVENDIGLLRLTSTGKLDTSFGDGGKVKTNISGTDWAEAVALQSDGKIVVVGNGSSSHDMAIVRYHGDAPRAPVGGGIVIGPDGQPQVSPFKNGDDLAVVAGAKERD
jgi:uncharacterized delta-60 repeat protein